MNLAVITMLRNEAFRLEGFLAAWSEFADTIVALDDGSTDNTRQLLEQHNAEILDGQAEKAWGNEAGARQRLYEAACSSGAEWLLWLDGDMVPSRDPRPLLEGSHDAVAWPLFDLWGTEPLAYREDNFWLGHRLARVWCVRNPMAGGVEQAEAVWNERGIHCGHLPKNFVTRRVIVAPQEYGLLHYGYAKYEWRQAKWAAYMEQAHQLGTREREHADSIVDVAPHLVELPFEPQWPEVV